MKNALLILVLASLTFASVEYAYSQTHTSTSKSCGSCYGAVSASSRVGDKCPHCGVVWGRENSTKSGSTGSYSKSSPYNQYNTSNTQSPKTYNNYKTSKVIEEESNATKSETENWILEKLKTFTPKRYFDSVDRSLIYISVDDLGCYCWYMRNYNYSFEGSNLVISYEREDDGEITRFKDIIPIYDISKVYTYKGSKLWISTKKNNVIEYDLTNNKKDLGRSFSTDFDVFGETDLIERLHKAFMHLKKFHKKPISKEPF